MPLGEKLMTIIVGDQRIMFCPWMVTGPGIATVGLELHDPNAKDEQIIAELYTFPMVYRANIVR
jgi:hypothetical protein